MPTGTLVRGRTRIVELLEGLEDGGSRDRIGDVIEAVTSHLAVERAALRVLSARGDGQGHGHVDVHLHAIEHARARFALFRLATSPHGSPSFREAVEDLLSAFGEGPLSRADALFHHLDACEKAALDRHLSAMAASLDHPKATAREVARAVERCERSLGVSACLGAA
jgi:hypothetical protein